MRVNYENVRNTDTIVEIEPEMISVEVNFIDIKTYYLTPLEALLYAIIQKYGYYNVTERKWVKIPTFMAVVFRTYEGHADIDKALDKLVEKRLIFEGDDGMLLVNEYRLFRLAH